MSFIAPWWLGVSALLGAGVVALHLLARRRPRLFYFPTARFVPDQPSTAASLAMRPTDLPVLLLRLLLVLLLGAALAQPVLPRPAHTTSIVLLDRSRLAPQLDSVSATLIRAADMVLAFDSTATRIDPGALGGLDLTGGRGSISAALVAALRAAPQLADDGDSLALTIISPFRAEEFDAATLAVRALWKGGITLLPQGVRRDTAAYTAVVLAPDDPLSATLSLLNSGGSFPVRLVRSRPSAEDTAWARNGGTLVVWPRVLEGMAWPAGPGDTIGGVAAGRQAVVAPFARAFAPPGGATTAAWSDGADAATTVRLGAGCVRSVAIEISGSGDLPLRPSFLGLARTLLGPCGGEVDTTPVPPATLDSLRGTPGLLVSAAAGAGQERKTPANRWLLLGAAFIFAVEPWVRRKRVQR